MQSARSRVRPARVRRTAAVVLLALLATTALAGPARASGNPPTVFLVTIPDAVGGKASLVNLVDKVDDFENDPLTFTIATQPAHGVLSGDCTDGLCDYTPTAGYVGPDSFTWRVSDGSNTVGPQTAEITVVPDPDGPAIANAADPLTRIQISPTLNCRITHQGDAFASFFESACGTMAIVNGVLYRPATFGNFPDSATDDVFTPISQSPVEGAGTAASPYTIRTTVGLGATGVRLVQTDSYVRGQESVRTDIDVVATGAERAVQLYRLGDCQVGAVDAAIGRKGPAGAINCLSGNRIVQLLPVTAGSTSVESDTFTVWDEVAAGGALPDTCRCAGSPTPVDDALALRWASTVPAGGTRTFTSLTTVSPTGDSPLLTTTSVDDGTVAGGDPVTYTVTVTNPGAGPATVSQVADTLAPGFTYVPGSTGGGTTNADPTGTTGTIRWAVNAPLAAGASMTITFSASTPSAGGTFTNDATAIATNRSVAPSGPGAQVVVSSDNQAPDAKNDTVSVPKNAQAAPIDVLGNDTDADVNPADTLTITTPAPVALHGTVVCSSTSCTYKPTANYVGPDSFTYAISDGNGGTDSAVVSITVVQPNAAPVAKPDTMATTPGQPVTTNLVLNDTDADGDTLTVQGPSDPPHGSVQCAGGSCTYTPDQGFSGTDSFTYRAFDGTTTSVLTATVTVSVSSVDMVATIAPTTPSVAIGNLTAYRVTVRNAGSTASGASSVRAELPTSFKLRNVASPGCAAVRTGCTISGLGAGQSTSFLVYGAFVRNGTSGTSGTPVASARVTNIADVDPSNNEGQTQTAVSGYNCTRVGSFSSDGLTGTNARDVLCGLTGNDVISPLLGNDVVYGNEGTDLVVYSAIARSVVIDLYKRLVTGQGTDVLSSIENATGSERADTIFGSPQANVLSGLGGADVINGRGGNDRLLGGTGNDRLNGGPGTDRCSQGAGRGSLISC